VRSKRHLHRLSSARCFSPEPAQGATIRASDLLALVVAEHELGG